MYGLDHLGIAKYPKEARDTFQPGFALGTFSNTFGNAIPAVSKLLSQGECYAVRIHLAWRDNHKFTLKDLPGIIREAKRWVPIVNKYSNVKWYFSGACENNLSKADALLYAKKVLSVLPTVTYVQCGSKQITGENIINEVHGVKAKPLKGRYIFSFDGNACVDADVEKLKLIHKDAEIFFLWEPRFNGRWESKDTTQRPLRRGWPNGKLIESVICLTGIKGATNPPKNWIYKSHAENHGPKDSKAEHPVIICPIKTERIILKDLNGEVVDILPYYGPYDGGGYRYYSQKWGYDIAREPVRMWVNGVSYGFINPVFRDGKYHD